jgi:hypothetical protein
LIFSPDKDMMHGIYQAPLLSIRGRGSIMAIVHLLITLLEHFGLIVSATFLPPFRSALRKLGPNAASFTDISKMSSELTDDAAGMVRHVVREVFSKGTGAWNRSMVSGIGSKSGVFLSKAPPSGRIFPRQA